ncbi:retrovirus-related pol polyprotein from transposon TNT 1-94 [Tanacetum coccineum]
MREKSKEENVNYDYGEIETKNVEMENSVAKLISENKRLCNEINHVKQVFKKTRVCTKEHSDSLINKLNLKSAKNEDLKAQIQDKVFVITSLKNNLQKLKGNEIVDIAAQTPSAYTIVPGMFKLELEPLAPRLLQNREAHINYLKYTQEQADILRGIVEQAKAKQPLDKELHFTCNKKNDRISRKLSRNMKNKVEAQPRKLNKKNSVVEPIRDVDVKHSPLNTNFEPICATCKKSMFDGVHDMCHVFTEVGLKWKPTGRIFTIVGNSCPLTRITLANVVPPKKTISHSVETHNPELKVYSRKPKNVKNVVQIVLLYLDSNSGCSKHMTGNRSQLMNFVSKFLGIVRFGNDNITRIMGYGDYQLGNVTISRVYYVERLGHNLFSVGQFCNADLEVASRKNTCFIPNLEGVDLLSGSRDTNLYTISLDDMRKTSLICLLSKASKTKSWLWHHSCALGKSKKSSHQPKAKDTNQEKLYLLHMDLFGPMRVASINGNMYILVIVDDYSRFTWVRFLRTKDELPEAIIKCIKNIQVRLNATVHNVRTDNGSEFVNQTLREFYENVGISDDCDHLFQPTFDEYFTPTSIAVSPVQEAAAPRVVVLADSPVSTSIDQDAPSSSTPSTQEQEQEQSPNISQGFKESQKTPIFRDDPLNESPHEESTSQGSSSNVRQTHALFEHLGKWTKDHLIANVIGDPSCSVSTRKQLQTDAMWCYFDAFLTFVEPKNFKQAMIEPS